MIENPTHRPGRNERCLCGSGKKYKHCCLAKDAAADSAARAEAAEAAAASPEPEPESAADDSRPRAKQHKKSRQPWKRGQEHALGGGLKRSGPRNRGVS